MARSHRKKGKEKSTPTQQGHRIGFGEIALDGMMAGVIGASAIALFFLLVDLVRFEPLFTPSLLGSAILLGVTPSANVQVDMTMVALYTLIHGAIFVVAGSVGAWLLVRRGTSPGFGIVSMAFFAVFEMGTIAWSAVYLPSLLPLLGPVTITMGNLLSALAMGTYLHGWQPHPGDHLAHVH